MDLDWREVQRLHVAPSLHHPSITATPHLHNVTSVAFDTNQELLWVGTHEGRISSYCGTELQKYTAYRGHNDAVRQIQFNDRGIISLSKNSVHFSNRRGLCQFDLKDSKMKDLTGMTFGNRGTSEIIAGGLQENLLRINLDRGTVVNEVPWSRDEKILVMKRAQRFICCGTDKGSVSLLDMSSLQCIKKLPAHLGPIADIDTQNNVLLTCGYSPRPHNLGHLDPLVQVFDLRTYRPLPPIPFHSGAKFVRMHPKMANTAIVIAQSGQFHMVDIANPAAATLFHAQLSYLGVNAIDLAPSGDALALADAESTVQVWGNPEKIRFSEFAAPVEWQDIPAPHPTIDINDMNTPLNTIGMPYYRETLLSAWPSHMVFNVGRPPAKIDPDILSTIKPGGYVPFPKRTRRYQIDASGGNNKLTAPQFLSEKKKNEQRASGDFDAEFSEDRSTRRLFDIPKMYRKLEIKYSKFGVDDFDFEFFNKTKYSGLETHITNSYSNSLLQLYKYTALFRNLALEHTATACLQEACLMCQLGFLFDMMEKAEGSNCQATNFLKTFSQLPNVHTLGLLEEDVAPGNQSFARMIETLNKFLLEKVSSDYKMFQASTSLPGVEEALGTSSTTHIRCVSCGTETSRKNMTFTTDFYYNKRTPQKKTPAQEFSNILKQSVGRENQTRGWCDKCHRYQSLVARKSVQRIPKVLMINANANSFESKSFWAKPGWLPTEVGISIEGGQFMCIQGDKLNNAANAGKYTVYELVGFVAEIKDDDERNSHLVSFIDVNKSKPDTTEPGWHVFNDFLVNSVPATEALDFIPTWKTPTVLCFQVKSPTNTFSTDWRQHLDTSILYTDHSDSHRPPYSPVLPQSPKPYQILTPDEAPHRGTLVALDAEFVTLHAEEVEARADGTRATIRPARQGLARVSVLRGEGELEGLPFIDDYIITRDTVVDYLTDYSGIHPGDLEVGRSTKALVPLKVAYKKLWILLNLGCIFVGHGLVKDFRTINIHIPQPQVVDTVLLFTLKNSFRKLSLRFLAYMLLNEKIQTMSHDSIEDARTALKLYRKWLEYTDAGVLEQVLSDINMRGREMGFKVPTALCAGVGGKAVEG
ncbi:PAB-dependent poly(A)-specific ribonuclease-like protein subunit pan2 [Ascobolus immersus RN42]|uniref:PAN2-PAN3 deadenylation complex catalytic subunit PAN2 n=1 Tax=Ascobolus immersus RN42 TaxID=1160509 RepID=A0A3N4HF14_ASCIM|nr:PAB-dependent poly(A)-specific ribonuclease-like protein subunit pan2 [Ascobolus immersus RN42]